MGQKMLAVAVVMQIIGGMVIRRSSTSRCEFDERLCRSHVATRSYLLRESLTDAINLFAVIGTPLLLSILAFVLLDVAAWLLMHMLAAARGRTAAGRI